MKNIFTLLFLIFSTIVLQAQVFPVNVIKNNGTSAKRINLVFVGDGYLASEQAKYLTDVNNVVTAIFGQAPFLQYEQFFNVYAIEVPSAESGAKHAGTATDVIEPASPIMNPNNYYGSRFDVSNIHRLLVPANTASIFSTMTSNLPDYDQVFVLVNSSVYGGSGGTFATSSTNVSAGEIAIHEIGHSFANLADEYWFNCAERKNRSANNNPATVVWKNWIGSNSVSVYTIEGSSPACYRPHPNCKMKVLGVPFCSVCREAFIDKIYQTVSPIDNFTPVSNTLNFVGPSMNFALGLILPNPNTLKIEWVLNGVVIANDVNNINIVSANLTGGSNTLVARVTDGTALSRVYLPASSGYLHSVTWNITVNVIPVVLLDFNALLVNNEVLLNWQTATEINSNFFEIQKSVDGLNFYPIGKVNAAGQSSVITSYHFTDFKSSNALSYYRLVSVDKDDKKQISPVKIIRRIDKFRYDIFPNPVTDNVTIQLSTQYATDMEIYLYDLSGRRLAFLEKKRTDILVEHISMNHLPAGQYIVKIKMGDNMFEKRISKL